MHRYALLLCLFAVLLLLALPVAAQGGQTERIRSFHSDITVQPDGAMLVKETITVYAAHQQINRGIYRDFPTKYSDRLGNNYKVGFDVVAVTRDGEPEPYRTEARANGVRVYMGDKNSRVSVGEHTYVLTYETNRQIGFFPDHDELYWNVTGNGWDFPIERASATVTLPAGVPREAIKVEGYTGPQGATGQAYRASVDADGKAQFVTTQALGRKEGLTIVVSFPKGVVTPPTATQMAVYFLRDNANIVAGLVGLLLVLVYFIVAWSMVGRDPAKGVVIPRYAPPQGYSPAAMRFIRKMGYDNKAFAATIINAAVHGYLTIEETAKGFLGSGGKYSIAQATPPESDATAKEPLASEEIGLVSDLFARLGPTVTFDDAYYRELQAAIASFTSALKARYQERFFVLNTGAFVPGVLLSLATLGAMFLLTSGKGMAALFVLLALLVFVNVLFHHLLKAPTKAGRKLMDEIEGFRMYLEVAEADELNMRNPPEKTPALFEAYLPYALALDVEQAWSNKFAAVLAAATVGGEPYHPYWYHGASWHVMGAGAFASSLGESFSSAISSSSTAPGSSSGSGGGGSSGGGGGGGGGGGW